MMRLLEPPEGSFSAHISSETSQIHGSDVAKATFQTVSRRRILGRSHPASCTAPVLGDTRTPRAAGSLRRPPSVPGGVEWAGVSKEVGDRKEPCRGPCLTGKCTKSLNTDRPIQCGSTGEQSSSP